MAGMVLKLKCDCGRSFQAPQSAAGKMARCSQCDAMLRIPVPDELEGLVEPEETDEEYRDAHLKRRASTAFQWKWLVTGPCVLFGSLFFLGLVLLAVLPYVPVERIVPDAEMRPYVLLYTFTVAFFVGGAVVGWQSEGQTILEPALASLIATGFGVVAILYLLPVHLGSFDVQTLETVQTHAGIWGLAALVLSVAGARVGEDLQAAF